LQEDGVSPMAFKLPGMKLKVVGSVLNEVLRKKRISCLIKYHNMKTYWEVEV